MLVTPEQVLANLDKALSTARRGKLTAAGIVIRCGECNNEFVFSDTLTTELYNSRRHLRKIIKDIRQEFPIFTNPIPPGMLALPSFLYDNTVSHPSLSLADTNANLF